MENIEEKLFDYMAGTLPAGERAKIEAMLRKDLDLKAEVERITEADKLMADTKLLQLDDTQFADGIMQRIEYRRSRIEKSNRLLWMALGIFAAIFAAAAAFVTSFAGTPPTAEPTSRYLPELPAFDTGVLLESLDNPALVQLVLIVNVIAVLLVVDRVLGRKMNHTLKAMV